MKFIEREKPHEKRLVVGSLFFLTLTVRKGLTFVGCLALKRMRTSNSKISGGLLVAMRNSDEPP